MRRLAKLDYVWIDGYAPKGIRTKSRYTQIDFGEEDSPASFNSIIEQIPQWAFDGSSTNQAGTKDSDLILKPVRFFGNPFHQFNSQNKGGMVSYVVLCEVFNTDDTPHETNTRAKLREFTKTLEDPNDLWFAVEQEYIFMNPDTGWPSNWEWDENDKKGKKPKKAQGNYYCGVGSDNVNNVHRQISETHAQFCIQSGISIGGINAEVMKSQWEYQVGPSPAISCADQLWISRYILQKLSESRNISISYDPKPISGNWNGSGAHINFSTRFMREEGGKDYIELVCETLKENHENHIEAYGTDNDKRLTGKHETAKIDEFSWGESDRSVSVRIPHATVIEYKGYVEDRRPSANMDPYEAFLSLSETLSTLPAVESQVLINI